MVTSMPACAGEYAHHSGMEIGSVSSVISFHSGENGRD